MSDQDSESLAESLLALLTAARDFENSADREQLNHLLRNDQAARALMARLMVDEQAIISRLRQDGMMALLGPKPRPAAALQAPLKVRRPTRRPHSRSVQIAAWAAVICLATFLGWLVMLSKRAPHQTVAIIKEQADAVWKDTTCVSGDKISPGLITLESGMAAIEFTSGARILLEGHSELKIISSMKAESRFGIMRVQVPIPAHGFEIATPHARVVDVGTAFGLTIKDDGSAAVKVQQGCVELHQGAAINRLELGAAAEINVKGTISAVELPDETFPSEENFRYRMNSADRNNARQWQAAAARLAEDPATLLSFTFEETTASSKSVRNGAASAQTQSHGTLQGTEWTEGRWPGKRALRFRTTVDKLLFNPATTVQAMTVLSWVCVDELPNNYNVLLAPNYQKACRFSWMLERQGNIRAALSNGIGITSMASGWEGPVKAAAIAPVDLGRWVMLATTYDSRTGEVIHYRDGLTIGKGKFPRQLPVEFGPSCFGSWKASPEPRKPGSTTTQKEDRNFIGRVDEIAILSRKLSEEEINQYYQDGRP